MMTDIGEEAAAAEIQTSNKVQTNEVTIDFSNALKQLPVGLLHTFQKPLENIKQELNDLTSKQETCIVQMQLENKKLCDVQDDIELNDLFSMIETYQKKLVNMKKEIVTIHERTFKLKKRALRLQQLKEKEVPH